MKKLLPIILFLLVFYSTEAQNFFPTQEPFGKNRIQYRPFKWQVLTSQNFEIYFYEGGQQTATLAAQLAESDFDRITEILGYSPFSRTKIFVYTSTQDLNQSNVGLNLSSEREIKEENLAKSRIEIAYSGNSISFKKDLVREISHVFVHDMLYGGSIKESLQNSLLLSVPDWFMNGITAYISEGWNTEMDSYMRDVVLNKSLKRPSQTYGKESSLVGQSIWNYVAERYGKDNISNILNLTRIIRNEQTSISSTIGTPFSKFIKEWREYYTTMAEGTNASYVSPNYDFKIKEVKFNSSDRINKFKISPDGAFLAYSRNELGRSSVEVMDLKTKHSLTLLTSGYKTLNQSIDNNTPLLSWTKGGTLAVIYENQGEVILNIYNDITEKDLTGKFASRKVLKDFEQVQDFDISDNGASLVLSAISKGQNDLFTYDVARGRITQLTNDLYDDLSPRFVGSVGKVIFTSNRLKDSLDIDKGSYKTLTGKFNLFLHEGKPKQETVRRLVDGMGSITNPVVADGSTVYFLSDDKGIRNIYRLTANDSLIVQVGNSRNDIQDFDFSPNTNSLVFKTLEGNSEIVAFKQKADFGVKSNLPYTGRNVKIYGIIQANNTPKDAPKTDNPAVPTTPEIVAKKSAIILAPGEVDTENYQFDSGTYIKKSPDSQVNSPKNDKKNKVEKIISLKQSRKENIKIRGPVEYNNPFVINNTDLDFVVDPLPQRGFGLKGTINMNDLLENHHLQGGIFITPNLKNTDLWGQYSYLAKRIDYSVRFDRRTLAEDNEQSTKKYRFNKLTVSASYPINTNTRVTFSPSYTTNRYLDLSASNASQAIPDGFSDYVGARAELVYDNTISHGINQLEGTRARVRFDHYTGLTSSQDGFNRIYADVRHYLRFGKGVILASRLSGGHSFGNAPKQTVMGGMDNWLECQYENRLDNNNPFANSITDNKDIFFLDYASPMRGFNINKLSGTSHLSLNIELRVPVAKYLYDGPVYSNFFKNLLFSTFTDVGTAWTGVGPFTRKNGFNTTVIGGGQLPFRATVTDFRNPFLVGYGLGARTTLLGYYIKYDIGWGWENKEVKAPISYVTLGYDF
jgi:Tol biopolymer transport system component